jgi:hypothetical protein
VKPALLIVVLAAAFVFAGPQTASAATVRAPALKVTVAPADGKKKVRVGKTLAVAVTCSKACQARVTVRLVLPVNAATGTDSVRIPAGATWTTGLELTGYGLGYLKTVFRQSTLRVGVRATDVATGQRVSVIREFAFSR